MALEGVLHILRRGTHVNRCGLEPPRHHQEISNARHNDEHSSSLRVPMFGAKSVRHSNATASSDKTARAKTTRSKTGDTAVPFPIVATRCGLPLSLAGGGRRAPRRPSR